MPVGSFANLGIYGKNEAISKYGYSPEQVVEYKGLVGDASDNIPGIKGIGEKTALNLLQKYGNLKEIYAHLDEQTPRIANLLREGYEQAEFSKDLATINREVDLQLELESCLLSDFNENEVIEIFKKFEFRSLITKMPKSSNIQPKGGQIDMFGEPVPTEAEVDVLFATPNIQVLGYIGSEESADGNPIIFECIGDKEGKLSTKEISSFTKSPIDETWTYGFEDYISQKSDDLEDFFDMNILAHSLSAGKKKYDISTLAFDYVSKSVPEKIDRNTIDKVGYILAQVVVELKKKMYETKYNEYVGNWIERLKENSNQNGFEFVHKNVDIPMMRVLASMENRGVCLDYEKLVELEKEVSDEVDKISKSIFDEIGHEFNLNSPKQLGDVLFTELQLPTKFSRSTREEVLLSLKGLHPCIEYILEYREASKVLNTYLKPFKETKKVNGEYAIHTDFKLTGSSSGRLASINPNMQNIPARGKWASKIREIFVPRDGYTMIGADYSQIEFRIMADISNDPVLVGDFVNGKDIHRLTASRILDKTEVEITSQERNLGKTINFAILFGQSPFGLSKLANITPSLAKEYIEEYFKTYSGVSKYIEGAREIALKYGFAQSMLGRTRYIAGLSSKNRNVMSAAIREAVNMPIQGGEADIMRLAMVKIDSLIKEKYQGLVYMQLQIHDELIFEAKNEVLNDFKIELREIMENIVKINVPLEVNISHGNNMGKLK
jgi:DNA polymerase-1